MLAYVLAFINIALRRSGPEDLPDSGFLLGLTLAIYIATQIPLGASEVLVPAVTVSLVLLFVGMWVLLSVTGYRPRYIRTVTAMLGTGALLSALTIPLALWSRSAPDMESGAAIPNLIIFAILIWSIVIDGHILARALSRPYGIGLLIAIGFFFLHRTILFELLPDGIGSQSG